MVHYRFSATLPLPAAVYFVERDTDAFRRLLATALHMGQLRLLGAWRAADLHTLRIATEPSIREYIPTTVKAALGLDKLRFEDFVLYQKDKVAGPIFMLDFQSVSPVAPQKVDIRGRMTIEPHGECGCIHSIEGNAAIAMFGVGTFVESLVVESLEQAYKQLPKVAEEWLSCRERLLEDKGIEGLLEGRPDMSWLPGDAEHRRHCMNFRRPSPE
eukprot:evm.model.scf_379.12 EVM.evm.TU.scf_379.12   scf_379:84331-88322(-)